jgi:hypothetical protein
MPLDDGKLEELLTEAAEPDTTIELDWTPTRDWPEDMHILLLDMQEIDDLHEQLKRAPADEPAYHMCMELLQKVRKEQRLQLSLAILELHGIDLPDLPQKEGKDGHDPDVLGGGRPL